MYIIFAIIFGLTINYFTGGLSFSAILCLFAGIFLVMPGLLDFNFADFKILSQNKKLTIINILLNIVIISILFAWSGYLISPNNPGIWYSMAMLGILPGGGLLMSWIRQSGANVKHGFALFVLNMSVFVFIFFGLNYMITNNFTEQALYNTINQTCEIEQATNGLASCDSGHQHSKPFLAYMFLIILPFLFSRIIRFFPNFKSKLQKHIPIISKISTFVIIFYIFSLSNIHTIFDQKIIGLLKIFLTVFVGYLLVFGLGLVIYKKFSIQTDLDKSLFWNTSIRFVTLGLVFGVLYVPYLGVDYISIFASAYIIQTIISTLSLKFIR